MGETMTTDLETLEFRLERGTMDGVCPMCDGNGKQKKDLSKARAMGFGSAECRACNGTGTTETWEAIIGEVANGEKCQSCGGNGLYHDGDKYQKCGDCRDGYIGEPNLCLIDALIAKRRGWELIEKWVEDEPGTKRKIRYWQGPNGTAYDPPAYTTDLAASKELLKDLQKIPLFHFEWNIKRDTWVVQVVGTEDGGVPPIKVEHSELETAIAIAWLLVDLAKGGGDE